MTSANKRKAIFFLVAAAILFCFTETCLKKLNSSLNPLQMHFSRYLLAGVLLTPLALRELKKRGKHTTKKHWAMFMLLGFTGITLVSPLYQVATVKLGASVTSVVFSCNPLFIALLAAALVHTPVTHRQIQALVVQIVAILVIVNPLHITLDIPSLILLFITIIGYSLYAVLGKEICSELGTIPMTAFGFICGGCQMLLLGILTHVPAVADFCVQIGLPAWAYTPFFSGYSLELLPWVLILYFGVTIGAYLCWFTAMECGTGIGSLTYFIKPALSPLLSLIFVGEAITGRVGVGIVLMLLGAFIGLLPEKAK